MSLDSLSNIVEREIREKIVTGTLQPSQRIKEEEIASELDISRPPIREAFTKLEADGLLVKKPRKGVFVIEPTAKDMWEVYTLKSSLYELSLTLAWEKLTQDKIATLEEKTILMERCVIKDPPDLINYEEEHKNFHRLIIDYSRNNRLLQILENIHRQVAPYTYHTLKNKDHLLSSVKYHKDIAKAIKEDNFSKASYLMKQHVLDALQMQYKLFNEYTFHDDYTSKS